MSTSRDVEANLIELLARYVSQRADDERPADAAERRVWQCTDPKLGRWIDANDFPFLIETLLLNDSVFSVEYPGVKLGQEERKKFASVLEAHCEVCKSCGRKRTEDLDWQASVDTAIADNREAIGRALARATGKN